MTTIRGRDQKRGEQGGIRIVSTRMNGMVMDKLETLCDEERWRGESWSVLVVARPVNPTGTTAVGFKSMTPVTGFPSRDRRKQVNPFGRRSRGIAQVRGWAGRCRRAFLGVAAHYAEAGQNK
jgi:hypothetical protein